MVNVISSLHFINTYITLEEFLLFNNNKSVKQYLRSYTLHEIDLNWCAFPIIIFCWGLSDYLNNLIHKKYLEKKQNKTKPHTKANTKTWDTAYPGTT